MKVKELIKRLMKQNPEKEVFINPMGDEQVNPVVAVRKHTVEKTHGTKKHPSDFYMFRKKECLVDSEALDAVVLSRFSWDDLDY